MFRLLDLECPLDVCAARRRRMSRYSAKEIMPARPDFLVELRGFEPLTSAVRHPRFPFQPLRFHAAIDKEKWRESHFAVIANGRLTSTPAVR